MRARGETTSIVTGLDIDYEAKELGIGYHAESLAYRASTGPSVARPFLVMKNREVMFRGSSWDACRDYIRRELATRVKMGA